MLRRWSVLAVMAVVCGAALSAAAWQAQITTTTTTTPAKSSPGGFTIPENAAQEKNPYAGDPKAVAEGKQLFSKNCQRCHGPGGKGDGPDADPDAQEDMDLTVARRAARNPDGVVFYKMWNGRKKPKMPAVSEKLTKDQAWKIVTYVQTLRQKP